MSTAQIGRTSSRSAHPPSAPRTLSAARSVPPPRVAISAAPALPSLCSAGPAYQPHPAFFHLAPSSSSSAPAPATAIAASILSAPRRPVPFLPPQVAHPPPSPIPAIPFLPHPAPSFFPSGCPRHPKSPATNPRAPAPLRPYKFCPERRLSSLHLPLRSPFLLRHPRVPAPCILFPSAGKGNDEQLLPLRPSSRLADATPIFLDLRRSSYAPRPSRRTTGARSPTMPELHRRPSLPPALLRPSPVIVVPTITLPVTPSPSSGHHRPSSATRAPAGVPPLSSLPACLPRRLPRAYLAADLAPGQRHLGPSRPRQCHTGGRATSALGWVHGPGP